MMRISNLFLRTPKLLDSQSDNLLCRYSDRKRCISNLCWYMYQRLENGERVSLIVEDKQDLKNINYFLSKQKIKHLAQIDIIANQTDHIVYDTIDSEEHLHKLQSQLILAIERVTDMHRPVLDAYSLVELNDRKQVDHTKSVNLKSSSRLRALVSNLGKTEKKNLVAYAQAMYKTAFRHIEKSNPFVDDIIHSDVRGVKNYIVELQEQAEDIVALIVSIELDQAKETQNDLMQRISVIRSYQNDINRLKKSNKDDYSTTEKKKIFFLLEKLKIEISSEHSITASVNESIDQLYQQTENYILEEQSDQVQIEDNILKQINKHNSSYDIDQIINKLRDLQSNINEADILKRTYDQKAVSFYFLKQIVKTIQQDLEYASYFIEENGQFINWKKYIDGLTSIDKEIVEQFLNVDSSWAESLDLQLSKAYIDESLLKVQSLNPLLEELDNCLNDYLGTNHKLVSAKYYNQEQSNERQVRPIFICTNRDNLLANDEVKESTVIALNSIPHSVSSLDKVSIFAYKENFDQSAVSELKKVENLSIINDSRVAFDITGNFDNLTTTDLNIASLYIGNLLKSINPDCKIYKLKSVAIISFLSDAKNIELRELLYSEGVKEIFSKDKNFNLVPGLLSDREVQPIILMEDGLFDVNSVDTILQQRLLRQDLITAGIEIIDIDNYELVHGRDKFHNYISIIVSKNTIPFQSA